MGKEMYFTIPTIDLLHIMDNFRIEAPELG
jgi:hypothetical protein